MCAAGNYSIQTPCMITIYVEGKSDKVFIEQLLASASLGDSATQIVSIGGYASFPLFKPILQSVEDVDGKNVAIFDADNNRASKIQRIKHLEAETAINIPRFFLPNDADEGCLEDLLRECVVENHRGVITCFDEYQDYFPTRRQ